ncbi:MAG: erythromycin esterase family protein [Bacteroidales bacterium]|nr:erythromycin esterase family protein [Bacteroidales bacterium]
MKRVLGAFIILLVTVSCNNSSSQEKNDKFTDWALKNSQKIETLEVTEKQDDLKLLKQIVGKAEVVCLGESRHDIHEQFQLKHRFIKYLVEEMNFTTFILEASFPYSNKINDYILNGNGNIDEIMSNMPGWFLWDTQEMTKILNWLKDFNQNPKNEKKVNFYGIDIVAPNNAIDQIFEYLQKVDKTYYGNIQGKNFARNIIEDNQWQTSLQHYSELGEEEKQILIKNYNELFQQIKENEKRYIGNSTESEYNWILKLSYSANEANKMFTETDRIKMGLIRDNAMANIALWINERNEKLIIWAHNVHIAKSEFTMNMFPENRIQGMGYILHQELKDKMISIGASFNQGVFQNENITFEPAEENTIDGTLAKLKRKYFLLDLKGKSENKEVEKWLNTDKVIQAQGFEMTCIPKRSFDAIFFTNNISKVNYNPTTLEKLRN